MGSKIRLLGTAGKVERHVEKFKSSQVPILVLSYANIHTSSAFQICCPQHCHKVLLMSL